MHNAYLNIIGYNMQNHQYGPLNNVFSNKYQSGGEVLTETKSTYSFQQ